MTLRLSYIISRSSYLNFLENVTPDQLNDFLQEITLMKVVGSHKNIVNFIGCCTKSSPNFLVVEYAAKGDLLSFLRERRKEVNVLMLLPWIQVNNRKLLNDHEVWVAKTSVGCARVWKLKFQQQMAQITVNVRQWRPPPPPKKVTSKIVAVNKSRK